MLLFYMMLFLAVESHTAYFIVFYIYTIKPERVEKAPLPASVVAYLFSSFIIVTINVIFARNGVPDNSYYWVSILRFLLALLYMTEGIGFLALFRKRALDRRYMCVHYMNLAVAFAVFIVYCIKFFHAG